MQNQTSYAEHGVYIADGFGLKIYVERGHRIRIISARKATQREQDEYNDANA